MSFRINFLMVLALGLALCAADTCLAQPGGRGGQQGGRGFFGRGGGNLLTNDNVMKELELVDDQVAELKEIDEEEQAEIAEMTGNMRERFQGMEREEMREAFGKIREEMDAIRKNYDEKRDAVLLDHQKTRLKQLKFQRQNANGMQSGRFSEELIEMIGATDEQLDKLKDVTVKVQEKLAKKVAELRKDALKEILGVFTAEQRAMIEKEMGDSFDFGTTQRNRGGFGQQGGRGGQQGGRGGQQGGRGGRNNQEDF